mmetsp:Transcript_8770/g.15255  ORF Transcript_8770/g.15255 Transcript_8770/m.15255 type:complete len:210 (+) Transcript_8770:550-1179(+)
MLPQSLSQTMMMPRRAVYSTPTSKCPPTKRTCRADCPRSPSSPSAPCSIEPVASSSPTVVPSPNTCGRAPRTSCTILPTPIVGRGGSRRRRRRPPRKTALATLLPAITRPDRSTRGTARTTSTSGWDPPTRSGRRSSSTRDPPSRRSPARDARAAGPIPPRGRGTTSTTISTFTRASPTPRSSARWPCPGSETSGAIWACAITTRGSVT